ncbi:DNA primase [Paracandidimonas soli]|uniref:DNA primase n=1 Tax=Paracandidimonas soli TaxID=1917182 RepID=A0A4V2VQ36_9BURK|nr:DNA primase [Paracandidimonas soli]TCU93029.1 DNA primase [Paracandidimonas soli]
MIPESFIQDLLARVDIADVVGKYVQLRKGGANLLGLCPFHNEKSPSFTVSPTKQFYHCFGCGAHGTAITFLIEHTGASFPEAVRSLAGSVGMTVPEQEQTPRQRAAAQQRKAEVSRHQQILDSAQAHYVRLLSSSPQAAQYLKRRGLSEAMIAHFGLGWSGTDRHGLSQVFPRYDDPLLLESGLVIESEDGRRYDRFRERVMFPIRNAKGSLIGFGGRIIGKGEPKYLNSPETPLFSKGQELYGLWEGRAAIRKEGFVLVVEGYMDVVSLAQHGLANAVATLGTATTPDHVRKLMRASDRIIFSFDGDKAGRRAAWRALNACLPLLRDDVAIRFLFLPEGQDPDSYIQEFGEEAFRATVAEALPLSRFMLEELASRHPMGEAEGRAACVHEARPLLAQLPEGALRLQIEHEFAKLVQLTPEELAQMMQAMAAMAPSTPAAAPAQGSAGPQPGPGRQNARRSGSYGAASDEPPGFAGGSYHDDVPVYGDDGMVPDYGVPDHDLPVWEGGGPARAQDASQRGWRKPGGGKEKPRQARPSSRAVTPMAKRLLRLLLTHPELAAGLGDQQLEILDHGPHLVMVRELIALINASGARHAGPLLQALEAQDPDADLVQVLRSLSAELLSEDELPDPQAEWNDALRRIELEAAKAEQSTLVAAGLKTEDERTRYQELTRRITLLGRASSH